MTNDWSSRIERDKSLINNIKLEEDRDEQKTK